MSRKNLIDGDTTYVQQLGADDVAVEIRMNSLPPIPEAGLPTGGSTGQVLTKNSATNFDASWQNPPGGGGSGDGIPDVPDEKKYLRTTGAWIEAKTSDLINDAGFIKTIDNASDTTVGGIKVRYNSSTETLYITNDGSTP